MTNVLVAQSGGPTAAINATLCGVVAAAQASGQVRRIYGAQNGIKGVLEERIVEIGEPLSGAAQLQLLESTPAAALGSCRIKLLEPETDEASYRRILDILRKYEVGVFVYIGGNDSMDTVLKLSEYFSKNGVEDIAVVGAPKTVDNDLCEIDHTPGFGSAAKYIAAAFSELACDCSVYAVPAVTIVEVMGRNSGWLTASSVLARLSGFDAPHLIYLPETPFSVERFVDDIKGQLSERNAVIVAVSEGVRSEEGTYVAEQSFVGGVDVFGHKYLSGTAKFLETVVRDRIGCKVRGIEMSLLQRCAAHLASATDLEESRQLGGAALLGGLAGQSGKMATLERTGNHPYTVRYSLVDISSVANREKKVPYSMISEHGNDVTDEMVEYLLPLIQGEAHGVFHKGVPRHIRLF